MTKLNSSLDPATFVGLAARIQNGGDLRELIDHADQLLSSIAGGDFTILERQEAAAQLMCNDLARNCLLKAMQCDNPSDVAKWQASAKRAFDMVGESIRRLATLGRIPQRLVVYTPPARAHQNTIDLVKSEVDKQLNRRQIGHEQTIPAIPVWLSDSDSVLIEDNEAYGVDTFNS